MPLKVILCACSVAAAGYAGPALAADPPLNLLFFGNSFTIGNGGDTVPSIVRDIATAAGWATPHVVMQASGGWTLDNHIAKVNADGPGSSVHGSLPAGQAWDFVVLQEYSTKPTHIGDTGDFRADALTLTQLVRAHSPNARPVLFETWARQPGHAFYTSSPPAFMSATAMQLEVRTGYALAAADLDAALGGGVSLTAPVGDAFEAHGWNGLYNGDRYHANNRGSLLAGLVLYATIYGDATLTDIDLTGVLADLNLSPADGLALATTAESIVPEPSTGLLLFAGGCLLARRRPPRQAPRKSFPSSRSTPRRSASIAKKLGLLVIGIAPIASADVQNFTATFERNSTGLIGTADYAIYVPSAADVPRIRGVLFMYPGTGGDWRNRASDPIYQEAARSLGLAIIGGTTFNMPNAQQVPAALQATLDAAAAASGRAEIRNAPVIMTGFSQGALQATRWGLLAPERTVAIVGHRGGYGPTDVAGYQGADLDAAANVHSFLIAGSTDTNTITNPRRLDGIYETYRNANQDGRAAWGMDWRIGHAFTGNQGPAAAWSWIAESLASRLPDGHVPSTAPNTPLTLTNVPIEQGWLAERPDVSSTGQIASDPFVEIAPHDAFTGDKSNASWLPTETMARVYQAFVSYDGVTNRPGPPRQGPLAIVGDAAPVSVPGQTEAAQMAVWNLGSTIEFKVDPREFDDTSPIVRMEFYDGDTLLGVQTTPGANGWSLPHTLDTRGIHSLTAVATDANGRRTSAFRTVVVTTPKITGVSHWRFAETPGIVTDHYDIHRLAAQSSAGTGPQAVTLPAAGAGSQFPSAFQGAYADNHRAAWFSAADQQHFRVNDKASLPTGSTPFTIEAFIHLASAAEGSAFRSIASHGGASANDMGWQLIVTGDGSDLGARHLVFQFTANGNGATPASVESIDAGFQIEVGVDYYVGFSFDPADLSASGATFYVKDLTHDGDLLRFSFAHSLSSVRNSALPFYIGASHGTGYWDGLIDEVRLTNGRVALDDLLIHQIVPEPATLGVLATTLLLLLRRG